MTAISRRQPGSLPIVLLRHGGAFVAALLLILIAARIAPITDNPSVWLATAALAGIVAGIADRGWLGVVFLAAGLIAGIAVDFLATHSDTQEAAMAFATAAPLYLAALLFGAAAYLVVRLVRRQLS